MFASTRLVLFYTLLITCILSACTPQRISLNNPVPEELGIYVKRTPTVKEPDFEDICHSTFDFVTQFNQEEHPFDLYMAYSDSSSVTLEILKNSYVTSSQQALGVFVTVAGIITPIVMAYAGAPIIVTFWYVPQNITNMMVSFSPELITGGKQFLRTVQTRHKFQNLDQQKVRQKEAYMQFLRNLIMEIETSSKTISK